MMNCPNSYVKNNQAKRPNCSKIIPYFSVMPVMEKKAINSLLEIALVVFVFQLFWFTYYLSLGKLWPSDNIGNYRIATHITQSIVLVVAAFIVFPQYSKRKKLIPFLLLTVVLLLAFTQLFNWSRQFLNGPVFYLLNTIKQPKKGPTTPNYFVQNLISALTYYLLGLGYAFARDWFAKERAALVLEKEKAQAELSLLRNQLNPHFLFNTINNIYYLALIQSAKTADALLKLSDLLRYVLDEKSDWVGLDKEYQHLLKFIELHRLRFPKDQIELNVTQEDQFVGCQIPPMILLTFVENAFKHGEPGTETKPVIISLHIAAGKLHYSVSNKIAQGISKDQNNGIGIPNLIKRMQILYPNKHHLELGASGEQYLAKLEIDLNP
jgi:sensor histidine kinase YesM